MDDAIFLVFMLLMLAITIVMIAGVWKVFVKAGQPGWACLIPFYSAYVLIQIAGKPGWWLLLLFIPLVNMIIAIIIALGIAQNFGKSAGFGIGLVFLSFIFYPVLGFGDAQYQGPAV